MNRTDTKLTGKEQAKINKRKKFYNKFERLITKLLKDNRNDQIILMTMNKKITFPEYDDLTLTFQNDFSEDPDLEIDIENIPSLALPFLDDARFFVAASREKVLVLIRQETFIKDDGSERRGSSGSDESYKYQSAFNWVFRLTNIPKLLKRLEIEKDDPTDYQVKQIMKKIDRPYYQKAWKPPSRRRRR